MKSIVLLFLMALLICAVSPGCSKDSSPSKPPTVKEDPSYASDIQPIFTASCALPSCHASPGQYGLILTAGQSYSLLVNVNSAEVPTMMRVRPTLPDSSYLVLKIEGRQTVGLQMPATGTPLSATNIQLIRNWVTKGAQNN
jgi:hypothetical protein